jgi:hypothetical protein
MMHARDEMSDEFANGYRECFESIGLLGGSRRTQAALEESNEALAHWKARVAVLEEELLLRAKVVALNE